MQQQPNRAQREPTEPRQPQQSHASSPVKRLWERLVSLRGSRLMGGGYIWLVFSVYLLLLISRRVDAALLDRENEYLAVILLQIMIFLIPAAVFCRARGDRYVARFKLRLAGADRVPALVACLLMLVCGCLLISLLLNGMQSLSGAFTLYDTFVAKHSGSVGGVLYLILAYAALPAVCEEFVFRGILSEELERYGVISSVTLSSLFFALLHFSAENLPVYLFAGAILSLCYYVTKSLFSVIVVHFCYNLFGLFGQPYITSFYTYTESTELFLFLLATLLLLSSAIFCGQAVRFYRGYADRNLPSDYHTEYKLRALPRRLWDAAGYPSTLLCLALFLLAWLLHF